MQMPEVHERMANLGAEAMPMSPGEFDAYIREEYATLGAVMRTAGARAQ
jgi:tripartite-type tricarboxylate transporter receptor subunit TctC